MAAKHHFRPALPNLVSPEELKAFPTLQLVTIDKDFGGWKKAQATHFADGGTFDLIYKNAR